MSLDGPLVIVGGGTIGTGLAKVALLAGLDVRLVVRRPAAAEALTTSLRVWGAERNVEVDRAAVECGLDDVAAQAGAVVEAVAEDAAAKASVLAAAESAMRSEALLATTTSSLPLAALAASLQAPERLCAFHVFNPVPRMPLVELAFLPGASAALRTSACSLAAVLGKEPVEVPAEPGFVVNRVLFPLLFEAAALQGGSGLAAVDVDTCLRLGAGHPMGPLALLDLIGLDVAVAIGETLGLPVPEAIARRVADGDLGRKTARGFYDYDD
jgi:3-hydroxybutyryl-CoA dehydrogenase